jgi:ElaB/YqjD/DUF883 family membrane-anchored ribosome-binding protein
MPTNKSDLRSRAAVARKKAQAVRRRAEQALKESQHVRAELNSLRLAVEAGFAATYGRSMTEEERRKFFGEIEK